MNMETFLEQYSRMQRGYTYSTHDETGIFSFPAFTDTGMVLHGFTARTGGVSSGPYHSLNLSFTRPDEAHENVLENFRRFSAGAGIPYDSMVLDNFEHGIQVLAVDATHHGMGYLRAPLPHCDGLITSATKTTLITGHADCVPLFLLDTVQRCIGLAHAGWMGTLGKIGMHAVNMMVEQYHCRPENMLAGIGPCICRNCFEVSEDLASRFMDAYPGVPLVSPGKPDKAQLDLVMASASQFLDAGIRPEHISIMDVCTFEDPDRLYSHRRDAGNTGGMVAYIHLLPQDEYSSELEITAFAQMHTEAKPV